MQTKPHAPGAGPIDEAAGEAAGEATGEAPGEATGEAPGDAVESGAGLVLRVLGSDLASLPQVAGFDYVLDPAAPLDCIAVIEPVPAEILQALLRENPLAPVAVFGHAQEQAPRADFSAPAPTLVALRQAHIAFGGICRRLAELPPLAEHPDRDALLPLALAHTRQAPIDAAWNPDRKDAVWYPLLGAVAAPRQQLESLAGFDLLQRRFFRRASVCDRCASSRLCAYEACVECGGGCLAEEEIVHHYACGHEAAESAFLSGRELICPKCRKELRHLGVDYDKPGSVVSCGDCGKIMAEPRVAFDCLDCGHATPGDGIKTVDWFHYDLTQAGVAALHDGRLPYLSFRDLLTPFSRAYPVHDFVMLARESLRVAARYDRPFSLMAVSVTNAEALRDQYGSGRLAAAFRMVVDLFVETVREADRITATGDQRVLIALPETPESNAAVLMKRFEERVRDAIELPVALESAVATGQAAHDLIEACE